MKTKRFSILTLIAAGATCLGSLGAAPAQAYTFCPPPVVVPAPLPDPTADLTAAIQNLTAAQNQSDLVQTQVLVGVHNSAGYQQALAELNAAQDQMDALKASTPYPQDKIAALATTILADENRLTRLEPPALDASPDYKIANANVQAATQSLQYLQQSISQQQQLFAAQTIQAQLADFRAEQHDWRHYNGRHYSGTWNVSYHR